ncbi:39S ribosomal protein L44, mitochondrial [Zygosaccharomyces mellis]|uniref:Large ribosomal subunit protein mL53 n=1 Tax=Zygosaccharomyces mellis TaxID=42258 RepID=A0A4C2E1I5_9SACH|nr:39S ribosomal protein L44, mitochondrial [Zygosaccharomyces mellis]
MITKYFSKVVVKFNPFSKEAKTARLLLSSIPPAQRQLGTQIQNEVLSSASNKTPIIKVTFKDKKTMEVDPTKYTFQELSNYFDAHSRQLSLKETIESS